MSCKCATPTDQYNGWECEVTGGACVYMRPNSKACAEDFGEGPDAEINKCEDCKSFYLEDNKRCCKLNPQKYDENYNIYSDKYIEDEVVSCGGWEIKK